MKTNNQYLKTIAVETGSETSGHQTNNHYLKEIAENTGSELDGKKHTDNYYLKQIAANLSEREIVVEVTSDKQILQTGEKTDLIASVYIDGVAAVGKTVTFYKED